MHVRWTVSGPAGERRMFLRWEERGGPPVKPPTSKGFGTRLLERSLAHDLDGTVRLDFNPDGLVCEVEAALD